MGRQCLQKLLLQLYSQEILAVKGGKERKGCVGWRRVKFIGMLVKITSGNFQLRNWSAPGLCLRSPDSFNPFLKQNSHQVVFRTLLNKRLLKTKQRNCILTPTAALGPQRVPNTWINQHHVRTSVTPRRQHKHSLPEAGTQQPKASDKVLKHNTCTFHFAQLQLLHIYLA